VTQLEDSEYDLENLATKYLTPNSPRKIVRRPRVEIEARIMQVPFKNGSLSLRSWGEGEAILLVHGWAANQQDMFNFVPEIVQHGFRAITMDLPAHGESTGDFAGLDELGEGVACVASFLGPLKGMIAHSAGAAATQVALNKGVWVPKIVLLASPNNYEIGTREFARAQGLSESDIDRFVKTLEAMDVKVAIKSTELVPLISAKALLIHSTDDMVVPSSSAQHLHALFKDSEILIVEKLGHRGVLKDAFIVSKAVEFLKN
jgi:pimeloyl-ACP methyl ester carboxylesterase